MTKFIKFLSCQSHVEPNWKIIFNTLKELDNKMHYNRSFDFEKISSGVLWTYKFPK